MESSATSDMQQVVLSSVVRSSHTPIWLFGFRLAVHYPVLPSRTIVDVTMEGCRALILSGWVTGVSMGGGEGVGVSVIWQAVNEGSRKFGV